MKINWEKFVGKRVLLEIGHYDKSYQEATILEVTLSGKVKIHWSNGSIVWKKPKDDDYTNIEVLPKKKVAK